MGVKKLEWAVTYTSVKGQRLRNEYETELAASRFATRQAAVALATELPAPQVFKLRVRRWEAGYLDNLGRWKTRRFDSRREATEFHAEQTRAVQGSTYVDPRKSQTTTVEQLYEAWIERIRSVGSRGRRPATPKTIQGYEWLYRHLIGPFWRDYPLKNLRYEEIANWTRTMKGVDGRLATADARSRAAKQFSRILDFAVSQRMLSTNPAKDASGNRDYVPSSSAQRQSVYLTMRQLDRLAKCSGQYELLIRFTGLTGLRWGEVSALQVRDLDLGARPCVYVSQAFSEVHGRLILGETKGHNSREIPLPVSLTELLEQTVSGRQGSDLVFTASSGAPLRNSNFTRRHYGPARDTAGTAILTLQNFLAVEEHRRGLAHFGQDTIKAVQLFQAQQGLPITGEVSAAEWGRIAALRALRGAPAGSASRLGAITLRHGDSDFPAPVFHDLRHTAVSLYLSVTKNVKHVQRIAGHRDATTTLNTYADLFDDDFYQSAAGLDDLLAS